MDLFQDWNMIVAGIKQTYGDIDILNIRARDFLNIYIPNMSKDTNIMNLVRIRQTPKNKLSKEERIISINNRLPQTHMRGDGGGFMDAIRPAEKAGEK